MKTQASREIQTYEPSGLEVRIHWNIEQKTRESTDGTPEVYWQADEAICEYHDTRASLIEKIIASEYTIGREFAAINNKDEDPEEYAAYQTFRAQAKELADGWLSIR